MTDYSQLRRYAESQRKERKNWLSHERNILERNKIFSCGCYIVSKTRTYVVWKRGKVGAIIICRFDNMSTAKSRAEELSK